MFIEQLKIFNSAKTLLRNSIKEFTCEDLPLCEVRKFLKSEQFEIIAAEALEAVVKRNPAVTSPFLAAAMVVHVVHEVLERWRKSVEEQKASEAAAPVAEAVGA